MNFLGTLTNDVANRYGLGANAYTLIRELLTMITGSPGGVAGFLDKVKTAGLGSEAASWLGHPDAAPLSATQVDRALGASTLGGIANRVGLGAAGISTAIGYALPKLIGALTPGGAIPAGVPSEVMNFLSAPNPRIADPVPPRRVDTVPGEPNMARWLWPLLGALIALALVSYLFSHRPAEVTPAAVQNPNTMSMATLQPRLSISDEDGIVHYAGTVRDDATRTTIINVLKAAFGADKIQGDIGIDSNRASAPWLANLPAALSDLKVPGVQAVFEGNAIKLGGHVSDAERDRISTALKSVFGNSLTFGPIADR
jgi:OmpA-OmpF porin, OOP family